MTASTFDDFRPRRPAGMGRGAMFALLAHVVLVIALAFGVNWRSSPPTGATAELWAAVPEVAAPAAVTPPPAPPQPKPEPKVEAPPPPKPEVRDAEIALEKAKAEKAREEREEREEREKAAALEKKRQQELAEKQERERREFPHDSSL